MRTIKEIIRDYLGINEILSEIEGLSIHNRTDLENHKNSFAILKDLKKDLKKLIIRPDFGQQHFKLLESNSPIYMSVSIPYSDDYVIKTSNGSIIKNCIEANINTGEYIIYDIESKSYIIKSENIIIEKKK